MSLPYREKPLHYNEQLERLKSRGLIIENEEKALHLLESISYFRLSNYWYPLLAFPKADKIFKPGATFNTAFILYRFDRELRKLVNGELEKIEIAIRAKMIYVLSHAYGPFWFNNGSLFRDNKKHTESIEKLTLEKERSDEIFIKDFNTFYLHIKWIGAKIIKPQDNCL